MNHQTLYKRIEFVVGKASIGDMNYYLIKQCNETIFNAIWISTLEVFSKGLLKGLYRINRFNALNATKIKYNSYFINEGLLQKYINSTQFYKNKPKLINLESFSNKTLNQEQSKIEMLKARFHSQLLKKHSLWSQLTSIPMILQIKNSNKREFLSLLGKNRFLMNQQYQKQVGISQYQIQIDYDSSAYFNKQKIQQVIFLGRVLFKKHNFYLVKKKQDRLNDAKWVYSGRNLRRNFNEGLQRFLIKSSPSQKFVIDKNYLTEQLQKHNQSQSLHISALQRLVNDKIPDNQFLMNYDIQIQKKQSDENMNQLIGNFIQRKMEKLQQIIKDHRIQTTKIQIVGKAVLYNSYYYLLKNIDRNDNISYQWKKNYSQHQQKNQTKLIYRFNTYYGNQILPFFIAQQLELKSYFLRILQQVTIKRIEKILAKYVSKQGVFYLIKFQNQSFQKSQWISKYSTSPYFILSHRHFKKFNQQFSTQTNFAYFDKETILIELFKEKLKYIKKLIYYANIEIDQKFFYIEAQNYYLKFSSQTNKIKKIVIEGQKKMDFNLLKDQNSQIILTKDELIKCKAQDDSPENQDFYYDSSTQNNVSSEQFDYEFLTKEEQSKCKNQRKQIKGSKPQSKLLNQTNDTLKKIYLKKQSVSIQQPSSTSKIHIFQRFKIPHKQQQLRSSNVKVLESTQGIVINQNDTVQDILKLLKNKMQARLQILKGKSIKKNVRNVETNHVIKNFSRSLFIFIKNHKVYVSRVLQHLNIKEEEFRTVFLRFKSKIYTISDLKSLWMKQGNIFDKAFRIISLEYLRKHRLNDIFNLRSNNHKINIKYIKKMKKILQNPNEFTSMKY